MGTAPVKDIATWCLFIDDLRHKSSVDWDGAAVISAKTVEESIELIESHRQLPLHISFDHDLGEGQPPATAIMWHLINGHLDGKWDCNNIRSVQVHSANPVGADNLVKLWQCFCTEHGIVMDITRKEAIEK
jgi:hypothetical protein